jgi:hypothetical protein
MSKCVIKCGHVFTALFSAGVYLNLDAVSKVTKRQSQNLIEYSEEIKLTQYCAGGKIEKNEMGGACGTYGGG